MIILKKGGEFGNSGGNRISKMIEFIFLKDKSACFHIIDNEQEAHLAFISFAIGRAGSNECISTIH